jgi:hypothetical protein
MVMLLEHETKTTLVIIFWKTKNILLFLGIVKNNRADKNVRGIFNHVILGDGN